MLSEFPIVANVAVTDLDRARAFYSDQLGLKLEDETPMESLHYAGAGNTFLEVFRTRAGVGAGHTEFSFRVTGLEDIVAELRGRGVTVQDVDMGEGMKSVDGILTIPDIGRAAWIEDPDGNVIGLFAEI